MNHGHLARGQGEGGTVRVQGVENRAPKTRQEMRMSENSQLGRTHRAPKLPVGPAYERSNRAGTRYLVARLGTLKLLAVPTDEISKGDKVWQLFVMAGPYATDQ